MILANSLIDGFLGSNLMGQGIVLVQILLSVVMVAAIIGKWKPGRVWLQTMPICNVANAIRPYIPTGNNT